MRSRSLGSTIHTLLTKRPSFYVSVFCQLCLVVALIAFLGAFIQQAYQGGNTRRWNYAIISGVVAGVMICSVILILGRLYHVRRVFQSMPKPYIPIKAVDVPTGVAAHIMGEYNRTAIIAHLSQPTSAEQEGWGQPDTQFGGIYFRERIRAMYNVLLETLDSLSPGHSPLKRDLRLPKKSFSHLKDHPYLPDSAKPLLEVFLQQLQAARYARSEPNAKEFENCMKIVALIIKLLDVERSKRLVLPNTSNGLASK